MILIFLIFLVAIQIQFGLFVLIQIIIWLIVLFLSNILIGLNPFSRELHIIRLISIFVLILILYINSKDVLITTSVLVPLSVDEISYLDDIESEEVIIEDKVRKKEILLSKIEDIPNFINNLEDNNYIVSIAFVVDLEHHSKYHPQMILSRSILINKFSSPTTITKFIYGRLTFMIDSYYFDESILNKTQFGPGIILYYWKYSTE